MQNTQKDIVFSCVVSVDFSEYDLYSYQQAHMYLEKKCSNTTIKIFNRFWVFVVCESEGGNKYSSNFQQQNNNILRKNDIANDNTVQNFLLLYYTTLVLCAIVPLCSFICVVVSLSVVGFMWMTQINEECAVKLEILCMKFHEYS